MKKILCLLACLCGFSLKAKPEELNLNDFVKGKRVVVTVLYNEKSENCSGCPTPDLGTQPTSKNSHTVGCLTPPLRSPSPDTKK